MFDQDYVSCQKEGVGERRQQEARDGFTSWVEMIQLSTASARSKLASFLNLSNLCIRNCTRQGIENLIHGWWMMVSTKVHAETMSFWGIPGSSFWQSPRGWGGMGWKTQKSGAKHPRGIFLLRKTWHVVNSGEFHYDKQPTAGHL